MSQPEPNWRPFWEDVEAIFDATKPVREPALFAHRPAQYDSLARLQQRLLRARANAGDQHSHCLIAGTIGNGKTTELHQFATSLTSERMVVLVDLWPHFELRVGSTSAMERLEPWELVGLIGLAILRAGSDRFGHTWTKEPTQLARALDSLRGSVQDKSSPSIDVIKLARGMAVAAGGIAGGVVGAALGAAIGETGLAMLQAASDSTDWKQNLGFFESKQRKDHEPEVREIVGAVNQMIMALQSCYVRPLVLIIDGLDRIQGESRLRTLFIESTLVSELVCDTIVTGPEFMLHGLSQNIVRFRTIELSNIPVLDRGDPTRPGPGLAFFRELVDKRVAAITARERPQSHTIPDNPFPPPVVDRLAYYSGGIVRDFIRMTHTVAGDAWDANVSTVTVEMVDVVLREYRGMKETRMNRQEIDLLREVMTDPEHQLPENETAFRLLRQQRLVPYPNETQWYYPHPLLTLALLKPTTGSAS